MTIPDRPASRDPGDFHETVETPEQVELRFELAALGTRSLAFLVDTLLRYGVPAVLLAAALLVAAWADWAPAALSRDAAARVLIVFFVLLLFAVEWFYFALFEWLWGGQTPGKRLLRLRVLKDGGGPVSFLDSAVRNILRIIDSFGPLCTVGILCIFFNRKHKRLGDLVAGTIVVREQPGTLAPWLSRRVVAGAAGRGPGGDIARRIELRAEDLEMVERFLERRAQLDPATRERLGRRIADLLLVQARAQVPQITPPGPGGAGSERFLEELAAAAHNDVGPP